MEDASTRSCERFCGIIWNFVESCQKLRLLPVLDWSTFIFIFFPFSTVSCTDEGLTPIHERTLGGRPDSKRSISSHLICHRKWVATEWRGLWWETCTGIASDTSKLKHVSIRWRFELSVFLLSGGGPFSPDICAARGRCCTHKTHVPASVMHFCVQ